jgi:superfamily II DNA/RNA helicase
LQVLDQFRKGNIQLLVASDVAARGLDIPEVSHVFNFDVPIHSEDYIHRIGRTGRAGREGNAFMFATRAEKKYVTAIEDLIGKPIPALALDGIAADDSSSEEEDTRGRRRKDTRGGRGRGRKSEVKDEKPQPKAREEKPEATAPEDQPQPRPEPRERAARDNKAPRRERPTRNNQDQGRRGGRGRGYDRDDDTPVIGLGDHVPAFLLKPVQLPTKKTKSSTEETPAADDSEPLAQSA